MPVGSSVITDETLHYGACQHWACFHSNGITGSGEASGQNSIGYIETGYTLDFSCYAKGVAGGIGMEINAFPVFWSTATGGASTPVFFQNQTVTTTYQQFTGSYAFSLVGFDMWGFVVTYSVTTSTAVGWIYLDDVTVTVSVT